MDKRHLLLAATAAIALPGCRGCEEPARPIAPASQVVAPTPAPAPAVAEPAAATPVYAGPSSKAVDGFQLATGFLDAKGKPLPQPLAGTTTAIYTTALDPESRPLGALTPIAGAEMSGFLVARDLRHVLAASATAPVREGADARALPFAPPGGGDHALVVVFKPQGGALHAVVSPVSVAGNLPQLMGPGLNGLSMRAQTATEHVELALLPADRTPTAPLDLQIHDVDAAGKRRGAVQVPLAVLVNAPMGRAIALEATGEPAVLHWQQPEPGEWLVLIAPKQGDRALAFHLTIPAAPDKR